VRVWLAGSGDESAAPAKALGAVDGAQCFAPIFNDSLANLVKSPVKHHRRTVRRIALRNFLPRKILQQRAEDLRPSFSRCPSFTQVRLPLNELV
jgi:hypothetical protein